LDSIQGPAFSHHSFRQGSSDKVYQASILPKDGGYIVTFAYGRRGSTLNAGTKTQSPVSHEAAKAIYDKLVQEHRQILLVEMAFSRTEKTEMFQRLKSEGREGVVFKHINAPYMAGRPNSGGPQRKFKFHATASFIVGKINAKRSV